jgi:C-terminal processing protease CtpA/Prc
MPIRRRFVSFAVALVLLALAASVAAQSIETDRQRGLQMLDQVRLDLVEHYYDPAFRGIDVDALVGRARQRIGAASSLGEILGLIAGVCLDLKDSHTAFLPPKRVQDVRYGWSWRFVGDRALVDRVAAGSDAKAQGLRVGDTVVEVAGYALTRANAGTIAYLLGALRPQPSLKVVLERNGTRRTLTMAAGLVPRPARLDLSKDEDRGIFTLQEYFEGWNEEWDGTYAVGDWLAKREGVLYWRIRQFSSETDMQHFRGPIQKARSLVIDLRGNVGGSRTALLRAAALLAPGTELATVVDRKGQETVTTPKDGKTFTGDIVVLVDSRTASSAEALAKFLQLRGARVIGDRTSGRLMDARTFTHTTGEGDIKVIYNVQVSTGEVRFPDGRRIEGVGVVPDVVSVPTPDDLENGLDPVLVQAARAFGATIDSADAFRLSR